HTEYGSFGKLIKSYMEADPEKRDRLFKGGLEELAVNVATMVAITALHGNPHEAKKLTEQAKESLDNAKEAGLSDQEAAIKVRQELGDAFGKRVEAMKADANLAKDSQGKPEGWNEDVRQFLDSGMPYEKAVEHANEAHGVGLEGAGEQVA